MSEAFEKVKSYLQELELPIILEDEDEEIVVVSDEESGLDNLVIDCEDPILIIEQVIIPLPASPGELYKRLLEINRTLIHGAFAIDEEAGEVRVRVYDRKVIEHIEWIRNNGVENASYVFTVSTESVTITHCLTRALGVYCRHCDRLQGGGPRGLCEEHEERTEAIYQSLNGARPMEEEE